MNKLLSILHKTRITTLFKNKQAFVSPKMQVELNSSVPMRIPF